MSVSNLMDLYSEDFDIKDFEIGENTFEGKDSDIILASGIDQEIGVTSNNLKISPVTDPEADTERLDILENSSYEVTESGLIDTHEAFVTITEKNSNSAESNERNSDCISETQGTNSAQEGDANQNKDSSDVVVKKRRGRRTNKELYEMKPTRFGQCGNQLGEELFSCAFSDMLSSSVPYWNNTCDRDMWFYHDVSGKLKARAVLVDSENKVVSGINHLIKRGNFWNFDKQNMIYSNSGGAGNNFALGYSEKGPGLKEALLNAFRKECEKCDRVQGIISLSSCAGGTGSGAGTFLLEQVRDLYPHKNLLSVLVAPYFSGDTVTQNINMLFTLTKQNDFCDAITIFENDLISNLLSRQLQIKTASFSDLNKLISQNLLTFLQPVSVNKSVDLYQLLSQLCPHPHYKLLTIKSSILMSTKNSQFDGPLNWKSIERDMLRSLKTSLYSSNIDFINGVANVMISRGQQAPDSTVTRLKSILFSPQWIPAGYNFYNYHHTREFFHQEKCLTLVSNNSSICGLLDSCIDNSWKMFTNNVYIHHYHQHGFTKEDFITAFLKSEKLLKESTRKRKCTKVLDYNNDLMNLRCAWTCEEKKKLLKSMEEFGVDDVRGIKNRFPGKSDGAVYNQIRVWRDLGESNLERKLLLTKKLNRHGSYSRFIMRLTEWSKLFEELTKKNPQRLFALSNVFMLISEYGKFPDPSECGGIDFRAMYRYIHCMLNGKPYFGINQKTADVVLQCLNNTLKCFKGKSYLNELFIQLKKLETNSIKTYTRRYNRKFPSVFENAEDFFRLTDVNPLDIPVQLLIKEDNIANNSDNTAINLDDDSSSSSEESIFHA